jgi:uncharacterized RDD family membrane protein YckC
MTDLGNAGLLRRLGALLYDLLVVTALLMLAGFAAIRYTGGEAVPAGTPWFQAMLIIVVATFFCGFWMTGGQTIGMRAWRLRLITDDADGNVVSLATALIRFAAACLSLLPLGLGFLWILIDRRRLTWHDRLSGTRVVRLPKPRRHS